MKLSATRCRGILAGVFLLLPLIAMVGCGSLMDNSIDYPHTPSIANLAMDPTVFSVSRGGFITVSFDYADDGLDIVKGVLRDKNSINQYTLERKIITDAEGNDVVQNPFPEASGRAIATFEPAGALQGEHRYTLHLIDELDAVSNSLEVSVTFIP